MLHVLQYLLLHELCQLVIPVASAQHTVAYGAHHIYPVVTPHLHHGQVEGTPAQIVYQYPGILTPVIGSVIHSRRSDKLPHIETRFPCSPQGGLSLQFTEVCGHCHHSFIYGLSRDLLRFLFQVSEHYGRKLLGGIFPPVEAAVRSALAHAAFKHRCAAALAVLQCFLGILPDDVRAVLKELYDRWRELFAHTIGYDLGSAVLSYGSHR